MLLSLFILWYIIFFVIVFVEVYLVVYQFDFGMELSFVIALTWIISIPLIFMYYFIVQVILKISDM